MIFNQLFPSTTLAVVTLGVGVFTQSAHAVSFNFSYTLSDGDILSGMLEGEIQEDNDTVTVSAINMPMFNGSPAPDVPFIDSFSNFFAETGSLPVVSFSGTSNSMDLLACTDGSCASGFGFDGLGISFGIPTFTSSTNYGDSDEPYIQNNWSLTLKDTETVPEPSSIIALGIVGGSLLLRKRAKLYINSL